MLQEADDLLAGEGIESIDLTAGEERTDDLEAGVLRRSTDEREIPCSTAARRESCWLLLKRWISSMKRMGRTDEPKIPLCSLWMRSSTSRTSLTPEWTALSE